MFVSYLERGLEWCEIRFLLKHIVAVILRYYGYQNVIKPSIHYTYRPAVTSHKVTEGGQPAR